MKIKIEDFKSESSNIKVSNALAKLVAADVDRNFAKPSNVRAYLEFMSSYIDSNMQSKLDTAMFNALETKLMETLDSDMGESGKIEYYALEEFITSFKVLTRYVGTLLDHYTDHRS